MRIVVTGFLLFCSFFGSSSLIYADIYALVMGDTLSPTGVAAAGDIDFIQKKLRKVGAITSLKVHARVLMGKELTAEAILDYLHNLSIESDDVILFYYVGHGYRTSFKTSVWPYLYLCSESKGLNLDTIIEGVIAIKPRLALIVADCCNNVMDDETDAPWEKNVQAVLQKRSLQEGYRRLFNHSKGIVICCASSLGEYAYCYKNGHVFTGAFWKALREESSSASPCWSGVLDRVKTRVQAHQIPYYEILEYN